MCYRKERDSEFAVELLKGIQEMEISESIAF